jgi:hypothetical protein
VIVDSIQKEGFGRSILLDGDGNIIAGNGTHEAAAEAGIEDMIIVPSDGTKVIAVQRTDLKPGDPRSLRLAIADNRAGDLSTFDAGILASLQEAGLNLGGLFSDQEIDAIMQRARADAMAEDLQTINASASVTAGAGAGIGGGTDDPLDDPTEEDVLPMTFMFTPSERADILAAINLHKKEEPDETMAQALVAICRDWRGENEE